MNSTIINMLQNVKESNERISIGLRYTYKLYDHDVNFDFLILSLVKSNSNDKIIKNILNNLNKYYEENKFKLKTINMLNDFSDLRFYNLDKKDKAFISSSKFYNLFSSDIVKEAIKLLYDNFSENRKLLVEKGINYSTTHLKCLIVGEFLECTLNNTFKFINLFVQTQKEFMESEFYNSNITKDAKTKMEYFNSGLFKVFDTQEYKELIGENLQNAVKDTINKLFKSDQYSGVIKFNYDLVEEDYCMSDKELTSGSVKLFADKLFKEMQSFVTDLTIMFFTFYQDHPLSAHIFEAINGCKGFNPSSFALQKPLFYIRKDTCSKPIKSLEFIQSEEE